MSLDSDAPAPDDPASRLDAARELRSAGRLDEALAAVEAIVADMPSAPREAEALMLKGGILVQQERAAEAADIYEEVAARFGDSEEVRAMGVAGHLGRALYQHAFALAKRGEIEASVEASHAGVQRLTARADDLPTAHQVALLLYNAAFQLRELGRRDEALESWAELVARFGEREEPALRRLVGRSLDARARVLLDMKRFGECLATCDEIVARFDDDHDDVTEMREDVAEAYLRRGRAFARTGRLEEEVAALRELLVRFGPDDDDAIKRIVDSARLELGAALQLLGRNDEALVVLDASSQADGASPEVAAWTRLTLGKALFSAARFDEAVDVFESLARDLADVEHGEAFAPRVLALMSVVEALAMAGRDDELQVAHDRYMAAVVDDVPGTFAALRAAIVGRDPGWTRVQLAAIDVKHAGVLFEVGLMAEAIGLLRRLIDQGSDDDASELRHIVDMARALLAHVLENTEPDELPEAP